MTAEQIYNQARRPGDPPWHELPNYDWDAARVGCFGKEHYHALAEGRKPRN